jgi:signal transduction histidine kinase
MQRGTNSPPSETPDEGPFLLATLPPSKRQIRLAVGMVAGLVLPVLIMAPFANTQLARLDGFIPAIESAFVVVALIICALLFAQFFVVGRTALLVLALGYLFVGLIMIPHMLTFPGAFSPTGLFGAGPQTGTFLGAFRRGGLSLAVIAYVCLRGARMSERSPPIVLAWSVAAVSAMVCGLTWTAIEVDSLLPVFFRDSVQANRGPLFTLGIILISLNALALGLLWARWRSVLDLWLIVSCCTWLMVLVMNFLLSDARFSVGWYFGRFYELIATLLLLFVLLSEKTALYAKLARSIISERAARAQRQIAADAVVASIAHEMRQPLSGIVTSANAGLRWLDRAAPDLEAAKTSLNRVVTDGRRASAAIDNIRALFKQNPQTFTSIDVNELLRQVLAAVGDDLQTSRVSVSTDLRESLPGVSANRAQLEAAFLNLIMNAIEAMHSVTGRPHLLRISSDIVQEPSAVLVSIEDTGTGIGSKDKERIFEPFFTTKSKGMGIGLYVCRAIVQSHGGSLDAFANKPYGTIFRVTFPSGSP